MSATRRAQTSSRLVVGRRLDHHPHERLGAARSHEHAAAPVQRFVLALTASLTPVRLLERPAVAHAHVDEALGQLLHRVALGQVAAVRAPRA